MARQGDGPIELYEAAVQGFRQTLSGVQSGQMGDSTPCTEWDVQKLIIHNLKVFGFAAGVLVENITVDSMQVEGPIPEGDPVRAFHFLLLAEPQKLRRSTPLVPPPLRYGV